jgi:hypothetical protein
MNYCADEIFRITCKGRNFMTPDIIQRRELAPNVAYELSEGRGIWSEKLYGVTVRAVDSQGCEDKRYASLSTCCHDRQGASNYINDLHEKAREGRLLG